MIHSRIINPLAFNPVVQFIQNDIGEEWRDDTPLWGPLRWPCHLPVFQTYRGRQDSPKYKKKLFVMDSKRPDLTYQLAMVNVVKESLYIEFNDIVQFR